MTSEKEFTTSSVLDMPLFSGSHCK